LLFATVISLTAGGFTKPADPGEPLKHALDRALDDERLAIATYEAVLSEFGPRRPFSNVIHAERRHEAMLLAQYDRLGLKPPANAYAGQELWVPETFAEACDACVVAEIRNVAIYDDLLSAVEDEQVREVFESLRWASQERHLPAFRRRGNNWVGLTADELTRAQARQSTRAGNAREEMFAALITELTTEIAENGPAAAIEVCSVTAPKVAEQIGSEHGLKIGRTSWKLRNPENRPPQWAALLVDERPTEPRFMTDRSGRLGVLTPILLNESCLQCHGPDSQINVEVRDHLARSYPLDQATGFSEGELRGWFWVEVSPATDSSSSEETPDGNEEG